MAKFPYFMIILIMTMIKNNMMMFSLIILLLVCFLSIIKLYCQLLMFLMLNRNCLEGYLCNLYVLYDVAYLIFSSITYLSTHFLSNGCWPSPKILGHPRYHTCIWSLCCLQIDSICRTHQLSRCSLALLRVHRFFWSLDYFLRWEDPALHDKTVRMKFCCWFYQ